MSYLEEQKRKAITLRENYFKDPGGGVFDNIPSDYVLIDHKLNIWSGIREDVVEYFNQNSIAFWDSVNEPSGNLLSSQIACLNHLFFMRQREDIATVILQNLDINVSRAVRINKDDHESGFVIFEDNGHSNYLNERSRIRGGHTTSLDAVMLGELNNGSLKLFVIEWKYAEYFFSHSRIHEAKGEVRLNTYKPFLEDPFSPLKPCDLEGLFTDPYYHLMRHTLLMDQMVRANEYGATDYLHIHVIPSSNTELLRFNPALPQLPGFTMNETWCKLLKTPGRYTSIDPKDLLEPAQYCPDTSSVISYLQMRYWN